MSSLLKRHLAPILPEAWKLIDEEATRVLKLHLAGRKIVDFDGPHGWQYAAVNTGRLKIVGDVGLREVQPLIEVRVPIKLAIMELDTVARGAEDPDLSEVVKAASRIAYLEDSAIFNGLPAVGIQGILPASPHAPIEVGDVAALPKAILEAKEKLRISGISGPYALVLGTAFYDQVFAATEDGYPLAKRIEQRLVDKPIIRAESVKGGAVISLRGGDYELSVGQDLSIGYAYHSREEVELYVTESFTFRVLEPAAAVLIT